MKKAIIPLVFGLLTTPVMAENIHKTLKKMGYSQEFIEDKALEPYRECTDRVSKRKVFTSDLKESKAPRISPVDFLHPRVFQKSESPDMIPLLIKLQKKNPTSAKITRKLAVTCLKTGQVREALQWFMYTYQRDRDDLEALWNMAALSYQLEDMDQAELYLKEYALRDPHSAWGRMSREFLEGKYLGNDLKDGFKGEFSRIGYVEGGSGKSGKKDKDSKKKKEKIKDSKEATGNGIIVIEGTRTNLETIFNEYEPAVGPEPIPLKAAKKEKKPKKKGKAGSLGKAKIKKNKGLEEVTTKAKPLGY